jgi:hypothetical protein
MTLRLFLTGSILEDKHHSESHKDHSSNFGNKSRVGSSRMDTSLGRRTSAALENSSVVVDSSGSVVSVALITLEESKVELESDSQTSLIEWDQDALLEIWVVGPVLLTLLALKETTSVSKVMVTISDTSGSSNWHTSSRSDTHIQNVGGVAKITAVLVVDEAVGNGFSRDWHSTSVHDDTIGVDWLLCWFLAILAEIAAPVVGGVVLEGSETVDVWLGVSDTLFEDRSAC